MKILKICLFCNVKIINSNKSVLNFLGVIVLIKLYLSEKLMTMYTVVI